MASIAVLGEPERQVLEEGVEAADVGQDHDPGAARLGGLRDVGGEVVPVGRVELGLAGVEGAAGDRRDRRPGVGVVAHGAQVSTGVGERAAGAGFVDCRAPDADSSRRAQSPAAFTH